MQSKIFAGRLLSVASKNIGESLTSYTGWLLAGFAASLTLIIANIKTVSEYIDTANIKYSIYLFLVALFVGVLQRLLFTILSSSIKSGEEGAKLGEIEDNKGTAIDLEIVFKEMLSAAYWPMSILLSTQLEKIRKGDFASAGRMQYKMAIIGSFLTLIMAVLAVSSIIVLVAGIKS